MSPARVTSVQPCGSSPNAQAGTPLPLVTGQVAHGRRVVCASVSPVGCGQQGYVCPLIGQVIPVMTCSVICLPLLEPLLRPERAAHRGRKHLAHDRRCLSPWSHPPCPAATGRAPGRWVTPVPAHSHKLHKQRNKAGRPARLPRGPVNGQRQPGEALEGGGPVSESLLPSRGPSGRPQGAGLGIYILEEGQPRLAPRASGPSGPRGQGRTRAVEPSHAREA